MELVAAQARPRKANLGTHALSWYFGALSQLYKWASLADSQALQNTLVASIRAIDEAISDGTELELPLPAYGFQARPLTLVQQFRASVAGIYERAAGNPAYATDVDAHICALDGVFRSAKAPWTSDTAAVRYLERRSIQFGDPTPLELACRSSAGARQAAEAINMARVSAMRRRMSNGWRLASHANR